MAPTRETYVVSSDSDASTNCSPATKKIEVRVQSLRSSFQVPDNLELLRGIGAGTYGMVAAFKETDTGKKIAVKKVTNAFEDLIDGKRILREVKLLQQFDHENIVKILDLYPPENPEDVYIVQELMEMDLTRVIRSKEALSEEHFRWFTHQTLCGVLYMHSMDVVHRDLKPSNILVNRDCSVKLCDFGLARGAVHQDTGGEGKGNGSKLTEYVVTRYYRAPEVVLMASEYGKSVDIWAVGCILCELIGRKQIFKGKDHLDQIKQILEILGSPADEDTEWLKPSEAAYKFVGKFKHLQGRPWAAVLPNASDSAHCAVSDMLHFDPSKRPTALECLRLPFFKELHKQSDEKMADKVVDWTFDDFKPTKKNLQAYIHVECLKFNPSLARRPDSGLSSAGITTKTLLQSGSEKAQSRRKKESYSL